MDKNILNIQNIAKKKIIDYTQIERFTECSVCLEQYKEPRILPCSHTYCNKCINALVQNNEELPNKIVCPECSLEHKFTNKTENSFPRNLAIQQLLDLKPTDLISDKNCDVCMNNFSFSTCLHCSKSICGECKSAHLKEFKISIQQNALKLNTKFNNLIKNFKKKLKEFLLSSSEAKSLIKKCFDEIYEELKKQQDLLLKSLDQLIKENIDFFSQFQENICKSNFNIKSFVSNLNNYLIKDSINDEDLLKYDLEQREHESTFKKFESTGLDIKKIEIELSSDKIYEIKSRIISLGKISLNDLSPTQTINNKNNHETIQHTSETIYWCPSGLVYNQLKNEIIISDSFNHEIKIIDSKTNLLKRFTSVLNNKHQEIINLKTPRDVCFNLENKLIIADSGNKKCFLIDDSNFDLYFEFGSEQNLKDPRGVCVDSKNRIYVCDRLDNSVHIYDCKGQHLKQYNSKGSLNKEFLNPEFICITKNDNIIISDTGNHRIMIFDEFFSNFITSFGSFGTDPGCFRYPKGLAIDSEGFIMVSDSKNNRLQLFDPNGIFIAKIRKHDNSVTNFEKPVGICILENGSIAFTTWGRTQNVQIL